jgi:hypothetical protein
MRVNKLRISILSFTFLLGFFYQPNWIYQNFYSNPRWVDDAWWSLNYPAFLIVYAIISVGFVELIIRLVKKYA